MDQHSAGSTDTILVADDDRAIGFLIATVLRREGFEVIEAADGRDALRRASALAGAIDLLITDIQMPYLDGMRLWQSITGLHPESKVLFITGLSGILPEIAAPVLRKPFHISELLSWVRVLLRRPAVALRPEIMPLMDTL